MENLTAKDDANTGLDYFYDSPGAIPGILSVSSPDASSHLVLIDYNETTAMRTRLATPEESEPI